MGHSHGGAIALDYSIRYPNRVRKLILVDSSISGYDYGDERKKQIDARRGDPRFSEAIAEVTGYTKDKRSKTDEEFAARLGRILPLYFYDPAAGLPAFEKTESGLPSVWAEHAYNDAEQKRPTHALDVLGKVRARTLILVGHDDWVCPPSSAERIHAGVAKSTIVVFPHAGHFPWIEDSQEFFNSVIRFGRK